MFGCCEDRLIADQVPEEFRELAIVSGYRRPGLSFTQSLQSLFTLHNETFNIWTHVISFVLYVYYTYYLFSYLLDIQKQEHQAILCLLMGCCIFPLCSFLAHLFSSMSPLVRHSCFMIDYLGITVYAFGVCITNKIYALPQSWRGGAFEKHFLSVMFVNCFICAFVACHTRFMPRNKKMTKLLRVGAFAFPYICGMLPCMYRVLSCDVDYSCDGAAYYSQHFFDTIFTLTFYAGHVPEIVFPGYFDIFFQSHSIFHVAVVIGTYHHLQGILHDMTSRAIADHSPMSYSPLVSVCLLVIINFCTVVYFITKMASHDQCRSSNTANNNNYKAHKLNKLS